jgi:hypothetical protein
MTALQQIVTDKFDPTSMQEKLQSSYTIEYLSSLVPCVQGFVGEAEGALANDVLHAEPVANQETFQL